MQKLKPFIRVIIELAPDVAAHNIDLKASGSISLVVHAHPDIDITQLKLATVTLAGAHIEKEAGQYLAQSRTQNQQVDLILKFPRVKLRQDNGGEIDEKSDTLRLLGELADGTPIKGELPIKIGKY